ncbi:MAG: hypothetical protein K2G61_03310, partial [Bacteroidaceae bacterium]|nr:hypothetical protein [Bacteroidaceae bacterium]
GNVAEYEPEAEDSVVTLGEQIEQPVAEQEEEKDMKNESKMVDTEVIRQMVKNAVNKEMKKQRGVVLSWGWVAMCMLLVVALLIGSFVLGYYMGGDAHRPSSTQTVESKVTVKKAKEVKPVKAVVEDTAKSQVAPITSAAPTELQVKPVEAKPVAKYEQMPGGAYEIVGVKGEHVMKAGDNLLRIARKTYGDPALSSYIVFFNHIENPDLVPLGAVLKLPELVKK